MTTVRVKRDGARGWHNIAADNYDPDKHVLADESGSAERDQSQTPLFGDAANPTAIPENWNSLHWKQQVQIAEAVNGGQFSVPEGKTAADVAKEILTVATGGQVEVSDHDDNA